MIKSVKNFTMLNIESCILQLLIPAAPYDTPQKEIAAIQSRPRRIKNLVSISLQYSYFAL